MKKLLAATAVTIGVLASTAAPASANHIQGNFIGTEFLRVLGDWDGDAREGIDLPGEVGATIGISLQEATAAVQRGLAAARRLPIL